MKKKLAFFIFSLNGGGSARILLRIAEHYSKEFQVEILTLEPDQGFYKRSPDVLVRVLNVRKTNPIFFYLSLFLELRTYLKRFSPIAIISFIHIANILCALSSVRLRVKTIVAERSDITKANIRPFWKFIRPFVYRLADKIVLQNEDDVKKFPPELSKKIIIINNPLESEFYITEKKLQLVSVGRLHPVKRFDLMIELVAPVLNEFQDISFVIYGEGPERKNLENHIQKKNIQDRILLKGHAQDVEKKISGSRIFLMTSSSEGQPNALIEAGIQGIPAICFDTSACFKELTKFFPRLAVIPEKDFLGYQDKIREFLNSPPQEFNQDEMLNQVKKWNDTSYSRWDQVIKES